MRSVARARALWLSTVDALVGGGGEDLHLLPHRAVDQDEIFEEL